MANTKQFIKQLKGSTPSRRFMTSMDFSILTDKRPEKTLRAILAKKSGRDSKGHVAVRHQGGRQKRYLRVIDFKRNKRDIESRVIAIEYDPNRTANLALLSYTDGEKRYILAPEGMKIGEKVMAGENSEIKAGNSLPLSAIPVGTTIHNIEMVPGKGGQMVRSAGGSALIMSKEELFVLIKMPSGEIRKISGRCYATIGQIGNIEWKNMQFGKAGRKRHMGIRPTVRGTAQDPRSHPHGGGEGRSGVGMKYPKTPWGKHALGTKTRKKNKPSNKFIVKRRN